MKITSPVFLHNSEIPAKYTCQGENINPPLDFMDIPDYTKSLVLIVDDPDAPAGTWVHWVVYNIPPQEKYIAEDSVPVDSQFGMTDFGSPGYGGPCPPPASPEQLQRGESGTHRYFFKLYALDSTLDLEENPIKKSVLKAMEGHILASAELKGLYKKS